MKIPRLFNRSSAALALAAVVFVPGSLGENKKPDSVQSVPKPAGGADKKPESIFEQNKKILEQNTTILDQNQQLLDQNRKFLDDLHILTTNDTPIKVRGGSMTFYREINAWSVIGDSICAEVDDLSEVRVEGFDDSKLQDGKIPAVADAKHPVPLPQNWTLEIYGGAPQQARGARLVSKRNNCGDTDTTKNSVTVTLFGNDTGPTFNSVDVQHKPHSSRGKHYIRFHDPDCANGALDQDLCERVTAILIKDDKGDKSPVIKCPDLDCTIKIGKPH